MTVQLNHTIVEARDRKETATFLTELLGLPDPVPYGPFLVVRTGNGVSPRARMRSKMPSNSSSATRKA